MREFDRSPAPDILQNNWEEWGERYHQKRNENPAFRFAWPVVEGQRLNHLILPHLRAQTQEHCSYCDKFPLDERNNSDNTIDHFKPKSVPEFFREVCKWENLYLACRGCQDAKRSSFDNQLLRPDSEEYSFGKFYVYNYSTHEIEVRDDILPEDQQRAILTRNILQLNDRSMCKARAYAYKRYLADDNPLVDDYNFRYIFE
jgi:uncharacterized protein (TIGR02646 family)